MKITTARQSLLLPVVAAMSLSACGSSDSNPIANSESATTVVTDATISLSFASSNNAIDLSNYEQVGLYNLPIPDSTSNNLLAEEASAITYNKDTDTLFVLGDGSTAVVQISKTGELIDSMSLKLDEDKPQGTAFYDTEGLAYLGNGEFALVEERYRQVSKFTYVADTTLDVNDVQTVKLGTTIGNIGMEGLSYDSSTGGFIGAKEADPQGVFLTQIDFNSATATNGSSTTENAINIFDPAKVGMSALNDVAALSNVLPSNAPDYDQLLIVGAKDGKVIKIDRDGNIQSTLDVGIDPQHEGLTIDSEKNIYVVNEIGGGKGNPQMFVYASSCQSPDSGWNLCLNIDQPIKAGVGSIVIDNGAGDSQTILVTGSAVSFEENKIIINVNNLVDASTYTVAYATGVFLDENDTPIAATTDNSLQFNSSGVIDTTSPLLERSIPEDNAINFSSNSIILTFDEAVIAGMGNVVISDSNGSEMLIDITDNALVTFGGKQVIISLSNALAFNSSYNVQISSGVITDLSGNDYMGINDSSSLNFDTTVSAVPKLLITEVNSKADGGDFFELYNFGASTVDLSNWAYTDAKADFSTTVTFPQDTKIKAGEVLIAILGTDDIDAFRDAWNIDESVSVVAFPDGEKLGKADGVVVYDEMGSLAVTFNYTGASLGAIPVSLRSDGSSIGTDGAHAGTTFGDANTPSGVSAVWDGVSTTVPAYQAAVMGDFGSKIQLDEESIGTPGSIPAQDNSQLLISEVNSNSVGGDFFELYNYGTTSLNLSGWVYDDDSASVLDGTIFPDNVVIPAGARLVVNVKQTTEAFKSIWNVNEAGTYLLLESGAGLGKGDSVILFDADGQFVTGVNYGMESIVFSDTNITLPTALNTAGNPPTETAHAGAAFGGGTNTTSAVWDGISTSEIRYTPAVDGVANAFISDQDSESIASPGK